MSAPCTSRLPRAWSVERLCVPHPPTGLVHTRILVPPSVLALMHHDGIAWTEPRTAAAEPDVSFAVAPGQFTVGLSELELEVTR